MAQTSFNQEDAERFLTEMQNLRQTLQQEWARVLNRWSNLKAVWHDDQFDRFEPVFERVSAAYLEAERDCEKYIAFLEEQIRVAADRQAKLGSLG